jgi:RHS repeat-associated protein
MLSPDNFVQNPGYAQNFNRYSYAYNNPLIYTDPDGSLLLGVLVQVALA